MNTNREKPSHPRPLVGADQYGGGVVNSAQATPMTLGLNIHIRKSLETKISLFQFLFEPFDQQCCSVILSILDPLAYLRV